MADLEEHAFKRDRRFLVRLVLTMAVAMGAGVYVYAHLTSRSTAGCAARLFVGEEPPESGGGG